MLLGAALAASGLLGLRWATAERCEVAIEHRAWSIARHWNEALLDAIRRDLPAPTVHARNLFHTSAAMWDAWAAYDRRASGYVVDEQHDARDVDAARAEAMSYAAYRVLTHRYADSVGAADTLPQLDRLMADLCYPVEVTDRTGTSPAALGNRIAAAVLEQGRADGANEDGGYRPLDHEPFNRPLVVADGDGAPMRDPNRWQPLQLESMISQNGIPITDGVQQAIGPHWGRVRGFALPPADHRGMPMDPGPPPLLGDPASDAQLKDAVVEVVRASSRLDPSQVGEVDASPGAVGANALGRDDGRGHARNPVTGRPYAPNVVNEADHARALAVHWADGPDSETPPGHWFRIGNEVSDQLDVPLRIGGEGPVVDRLEWDVKLYLALGGANHDAAVAAWGVKGHYDTARPISLIRHMGRLGQSSDPEGPAYHPEGLPLVDGLIEVVTADTTAAGQRHEALAGAEGRIAVRSWIAPAHPERETGRVDWLLATRWSTYQLATFVSPAFAGYVSGHSTFSRASAEVLAAFTGDAHVPGGLGSVTVPAWSFEVERGPARDVELQWATYFDAADMAGRSRIHGGIHVPFDDWPGRRLGADCGIAAWRLAQRYYTGAAGASG